MREDYKARFFSRRGENSSMLREYFRKAYRTLMPLLYSRSNYKLFLKTSFTSLDKRIRIIMCSIDMMPSIVKPIPIKAPFGNSMLVIAPHQDDEMIGCGGAMLLQLSKGKKLHIVFVQDGGDEHQEEGLSRNEMINIREAEACKVAEQMGGAHPVFLRYASLNQEKLAEIADDLKKQIIMTGADVIFIPFFLDRNTDHVMSNYALAEALSDLPDDIKIFGYEVWGLCIPNVAVNIDAVVESKKKILSYYESQNKRTDYINSTIGLNMYHSRSFGTGTCKYAERFFEIPAKEYVDVVSKLRREHFLESNL